MTWHRLRDGGPELGLSDCGSVTEDLPSQRPAGPGLQAASDSRCSGWAPSGVGLLFIMNPSR